MEKKKYEISKPLLWKIENDAPNFIFSLTISKRQILLGRFNAEVYKVNYERVGNEFIKTNIDKHGHSKLCHKVRENGIFWFSPFYVKKDVFDLDKNDSAINERGSFKRYSTIIPQDTLYLPVVEYLKGELNSFVSALLLVKQWDEKNLRTIQVIGSDFEMEIFWSLMEALTDIGYEKVFLSKQDSRGGDFTRAVAGEIKLK